MLRTLERLAQQDVAMILLKPELYTRTKVGKLMVTTISALAEFKRELLIDRTKERMTHARAQGRVAEPKPDEQIVAVRASAAVGQPVSTAARLVGVPRPTILRRWTPEPMFDHLKVQLNGICG